MRATQWLLRFTIILLTTKQQYNKTTRQQNNNITKQQYNKTTRQQNNIYYFIIILQSLSWKMRDSATGESVLMMEKMYQWPSEPMR